ncbi:MULTISPECIES: diguanylate phosphodiesterase [Rahnella]|uniref:Diguanylate phosphodiesterase n=1 Tax=Rahnella laticis TaxID=2787622 RepID=A0ABS0EAC2_9GAMM|nr:MULTISPECIES: diguanylate phosphodiesterase [Rahnella]MBF7982031.1 diguanylate phosphodiesterase [Rahnella laticis]MBF8002121.1 diguanylate phosphodiesterase [Rahnella sp. LAC-M12]
MLSTLIYRSRICEGLSPSSLEGMISHASSKNELSSVTGILLFDGTHFFQLLEGPEKAVSSIFETICADSRHHNVVELMRDYAPARRFGKVGMEIFDLQSYSEDVVLQAVLDKGTSKYRLTYDDRALQFLCTFVQARERDNYLDIPQAGVWSFQADGICKTPEVVSLPDLKDIGFTFQPIIDPLSLEILSYESALCGPAGASAISYYSKVTHKNIYEADLEAQKLAISVAKKLGIGDKTLTLKFLPMTLITVPDAITALLGEIEKQGLVAEQIVIAITENSEKTRDDNLAEVLKQLKASGMRLAIDDFGSGSAGLLLLTRFQPEKIMVDQGIIRDVHKSGPKQAIVQAIIKFCSSLEISVIATGIIKPEEWMWLDAAGISNFQGELFASPALNAFPAVNWPEADEIVIKAS